MLNSKSNHQWSFKHNAFVIVSCLGPFQSYVVVFEPLKVFLRKDLKRSKSNSVHTEPPTASHLTDSKAKHRTIELLPSSALMSGYTATYATWCVLSWLTNGFILTLYEKTCVKKQHWSIPSFEPATLRNRERAVANRCVFQLRTTSEPLCY